MTEKEILAQIEHPFLVRMKMSFQDDRKLYFLLEYCPGGELFSLLAAKDKLSEEQYSLFEVGPSSTLPRSSSLLKPCTSTKSSTGSNFPPTQSETRKHYH